MKDTDPYHAPNGQKWPRWALLFLFTGGMGLFIHAFLMLFLDEKARILPASHILIGFILMGVGCTLLSELMRQHPDWMPKDRNPKTLRIALFWAALTPIAFIQTIPAPLIVIAAISLTTGLLFTFIVSLFSIFLMIWLHWVSIDLTHRTYQHSHHQWIAQSVLYLGILGAILLIGGPILPSFTLP